MAKTSQDLTISIPLLALAQGGFSFDKQCRATGATVTFAWVNDGPMWFKDAIAAGIQSPELVTLFLDFKPRPEGTGDGKWRREGGFQLPGLEIIAYPRWDYPTRTFQAKATDHPLKYTRLEATDMNPEGGRFLFRCNFSESTSFENLESFSTEPGYFCRGGLAVRPGINALVDLSGKDLLKSLPSRIRRAVSLVNGWVKES